ncbi:phosphoribosylformylglycinamidine synthase subunit PurQ [Synechococcus sp. PCC 7336]|uniref:phosphoribosylformylglycinamidine synthase subunit PurQ n=1 Tax=Synechococcus sp. PCC 7336 TaxID=195250 RepID=UPI00034C24EF|nr:phosphoribosylformylglycinamidine synthase subunit PurQ [Synechococcus sp. PCC 7336]
MGQCKFGIIVFPGSNCDRDVATVTRGLLGCPTRLIWHQDTDLSDIDVVVLPGGFSYGDYLRCGAIAHFSPAMQAVKAHAERGGFVLGICNGWQILLESGLLPGALIRNRDLQFICERVGLRLERSDSIWTRQYAPGQQVTLPIAHGEGSYYCDDETLKSLEANNQIVWRYCDRGNGVDNPNGSVGAIAGICNRAGNVLGMMPHPERAVESILNRGEPGQCDGLPLWQSIVAAVDAAKLAAA